MSVRNKYHLPKAIRQFLSYFCVGGIAAIVEWVMFALFANALGINYIVSTVAAFFFSTTVNLILGKLWTFRDSHVYNDNRKTETILVFGVSAVGLFFNMALMYLFVSVMRMDTAMLKTLSKIAATGIVFIWNFLIRKLVIYRN